MFGTIGFWVIPLMIIAWIAREIFNSIIKKKEIKYSEASKTTIDMVKRIYAELPVMEKLVQDFYYTHRPVGFDPPSIDPYDASRKIGSFCEMVVGTRVFMPDSISNNLNEICETLNTIVDNLGMRELTSEDEDYERKNEYEERAQKLLISKLPELSKQIETEFREYLGTD